MLLVPSLRLGKNASLAASVATKLNTVSADDIVSGINLVLSQIVEF